MDSLLSVIVTQVITAAVLGGALWQKQASIEKQAKARHKDTKEAIEKLTDQLKAQNGRIDNLEQWRAERRGFEEGYGTAKDRYEDGPNQKLQG